MYICIYIDIYMCMLTHTHIYICIRITRIRIRPSIGYKLFPVG